MSKQRVEDLVNQLAELRQAFTALQAIVKDQGEEIALLKRNMIRMESDFVYTGPSIAYSTPNKSPSGSQELLSVFQRSGTLLLTIPLITYVTMLCASKYLPFAAE